MYDNFMVIGETEFELEAQKFLQDGYYASDVGDIMPLAMANILHANFIIFTNNCRKLLDNRSVSVAISGENAACASLSAHLSMSEAKFNASAVKKQFPSLATG